MLYRLHENAKQPGERPALYPISHATIAQRPEEALSFMRVQALAQSSSRL